MNRNGSVAVPGSPTGRNLGPESLLIQSLDSLHALVELAVAFPSENFLALSYILALGLSSSMPFTFERSQFPKAAQSRQRLKHGSRSLLRYFARYFARSADTRWA